MRKIFLTAILAVMVTIAFVLNSCESKTYEDISDSSENPTYTKNIKNVIVNNCYPCHSDAGENFPKMETYEQTKDAAQNGNMICRIDDQSCGSVMPQQGRMPQTTIDLIKLWVSQGYIN